jgi:hypothetical protein
MVEAIVGSDGRCGETFLGDLGDLGDGGCGVMMESRSVGTVVVCFACFQVRMKTRPRNLGQHWIPIKSETKMNVPGFGKCTCKLSMLHAAYLG